MSREPIDRETKRRMGFLVAALRNCVLVGNPAPSVQEMRQRMADPRPGDWVVETSTLGLLLHRDPDLEDDRWDGQFTRYLRTDVEWISWVEASNGEDDSPGGFWETYLVCENPDGTEFRWTNATLEAVPQSMEFGRIPLPGMEASS